MPHTITTEPDGYRMRLTGRLSVKDATAVIDDLDARGATDAHRYELVDLTSAEPLDLSHQELHEIARRAMRSSRRRGVRLALVGSADTLGTNGRDYAHILGTWMSPTAWTVATFADLATGERWATSPT